MSTTQKFERSNEENYIASLFAAVTCTGVRLSKQMREYIPHCEAGHPNTTGLDSFHLDHKYLGARPDTKTIFLMSSISDRNWHCYGQPGAPDLIRWLVNPPPLPSLRPARLRVCDEKPWRSIVYWTEVPRGALSWWSILESLEDDYFWIKAKKYWQLLWSFILNISTFFFFFIPLKKIGAILTVFIYVFYLHQGLVGIEEVGVRCDFI